jgi:hypothetical protein
MTRLLSFRPSTDVWRFRLLKKRRFVKFEATGEASRTSY